MNKIILTKGLPASGKSTWAREYQTQNPNTVRVNKDDLRSMLHNGVWSSGREDFVLKVRNFIVEESLENGHDVIVDDTNLHPKHEATLREIAKQQKAQFEIKDFTDVDIEVCIERDLRRANSVGEKTIRRMYRDFLAPEVEKVHHNPTLRNMIICDLDGTLCLLGGRNPYDRDFENDKPNIPVMSLLRGLAGNFGINNTIFVSGRTDKYREVTEKWLDSYGFTTTNLLFMRKDGDTRKDSIIKREIYDNEIKGKYNVLFVLDDRNQVVDLWRSLGLPCFQVADGDF